MSNSALLLTAASLVTALWGTACGTADPGSDANVRVHVDRVVIDRQDIPVLVLAEDDGERWLPIWIGTAEARSIALQMEQRSSPRPNTHDLARNVIYGLDGDVERVVVTELKEGTYYARLGLRLHDRSIEIDSRPSDAIAIALRTNAPIYVRKTLFEAESIPPPTGEEAPITRGTGREI
ncbi:MAG TPA: bifunctional nuclease family protein [Myxococcota bacterium]